MTPPRRIRVLTVDDHPLIREGIAVMINRAPDMEVVAMAATGEEAIELFRQHKPDVVLVDLRLPTMSGLDVIRVMHQEREDARLIVLTMYQGDEDIYRALEAGAVSYVLKEAAPDDLVNVIREASEGGRPIPLAVQEILAQRSVQGNLTSREVEVVQLISEGRRNKEIALLLGISLQTTKSHVKHVLAKLEVEDRSAVAAAAARRGIIRIG